MLQHEPRQVAVQLVVADQGIGSSEADQAQLFTESLRYTNAAALRVPGSGLGLAIVRRIVDRHQGSIAVPGSGTARRSP